jgi:hypothetical protein
MSERLGVPPLARQEPPLARGDWVSNCAMVVVVGTGVHNSGSAAVGLGHRAVGTDVYEKPGLPQVMLVGVPHAQGLHEKSHFGVPYPEKRMFGYVPSHLGEPAGMPSYTSAGPVKPLGTVGTHR